MTVTNSEVDMAGEMLRRLVRQIMAGPETGSDLAKADRADWKRAVAVVEQYRELHAPALVLVPYVIGNYVTRVGIAGGSVTSRPKTLPRIVSKLVRQPTMRMSQMEDVAGVRVVVPTLASVRDVAAFAESAWPGRRLFDYIARPQPDGYRCLHLVFRAAPRITLRPSGEVFEVGGLVKPMRVELQVRSVRQDRWAQAVEDAYKQTGYNLKDGKAPGILKRYFLVAAEQLAREDAGQPSDPTLDTELKELRERVRPLYKQHQP